MRPVLRSSILAFGVGISAFACAVVDPGAEESSSNLTPAEELSLARRAVSLVTGNNARCNSCHTAGKDDMRRWAEAMRDTEANCLAPSLSLSAQERVACLKDDPSVNAYYSAGRIGFYSAAVNTAAMQQLFKDAFGEEGWQKEFANFKRYAGMPAGTGTPFSEAEFKVVKDWALAGLPRLDDVLTEPGAFPCEESITPKLLEHIDRMKVEGWGARLTASATPMAGCGSATDALGCLKAFPDVTATFGASSTNQTLRQVRKLNFRTSYWTRSSADGRYAAFGGGPSKIIDIEAPETDPPVTVSAPYDPVFFPNNDGFSYAGAGGGGIRVCKQSVLLNAFAGDRRVTFNEPGCSKIIDTVYQSVGAALDGSLFFMATGTHTNDAGGGTGPVSASFGENATTTLTPMYNDGTKYVPGEHVKVKIPFEGDQQMSASNTLLVTRFGDKARTAGYRVRRVVPTFGSPGGGPTSSLRVDTEVLGTVCIAGGKPQQSFDERFLALHQYTDANANPMGLPAATSNIWVVDLKTGKKVMVTKVGAGARALYPHFRADGWLYFLIRETGGKETVVASDVVLKMAN